MGAAREAPGEPARGDLGSSIQRVRRDSAACSRQRIRIGEEAVDRMLAETRTGRGRRLVDALIVRVTRDRQLELGINRSRRVVNWCGPRVVGARRSRPEIAEAEGDRIEGRDAHRLGVLRGGRQHATPIPPGSSSGWRATRT